jgi:hypothetical protein
VLVLLIVNCLLIYIQYNQAEGSDAKGPKVVTYSQEIEVINRPDTLHIRHHFRGLSNARHEIVWPATSINRSCYLADAASCDRLVDNTTAFHEGENDRQSITYEIPKQGPMNKAVLFKEPFTVLHGSTVEFTLFHMTDEIGIGGFWVNGLKQIGTKEMTNIDYSLFSGSGEVKNLYWQKNKLPLLYAGDRLSVFGKGGDAGRLLEVDNALKLIDAEYSTVVIDNMNPAVSSARFIVSENPDVEKVADQLLTAAMYKRFTMPQKERLTAEVTASILAKKPVGLDKSRKLYQVLTESLSVEELEKLTRLISDLSGQEINATVLDGLTGEVTGFKTSYFKRNSQGDTAIHPFLIEDPRKAHFEGEAFSDIRIILKDGKMLYPAKKVLSVAGYTVTSNEQSIYIENDFRKFRFPKKDLFYVYNEHKYDVVTMPFEVLEGDFYFDENWFKRLFLLNIEKTADTIDIIRISTLIEEAEK